MVSSLFLHWHGKCWCQGMENFTKGDVMLLERMAGRSESFTSANDSRERLAHARPFCYTARQTIQQHCVRRMVARVKPQNSSARATIRWMCPTGRISFRGFLQGFCGPHSETGGDCALSFSFRSETKETRRTNK